MYGPRSYADLTWERSANYSARTFLLPMGPGKREHIVVDTLLPTKCFPVCPRAQHLYLGHKKCFWFFSETFCVRNNIHFVSRAFVRPRNIMSNNVSATMCSRLPGSYLHTNHCLKNSCEFREPPIIFRFLIQKKPHNLQLSATHCGSIVQKTNRSYSSAR